MPVKIKHGVNSMNEVMYLNFDELTISQLIFDGF